MKYYLEQITDGFDLDRYLFDSHEEALEYLCEHIGYDVFNENRRILKVIGGECYKARWSIYPVLNWERRVFGEPRLYVEERRENYASISECSADPNAFREEYVALSF